MTAPAQQLPLMPESGRCPRCGRERLAGSASALDLARLAGLREEEFAREIACWTGRCGRA